jgi:hypothetical protein
VPAGRRLAGIVALLGLGIAVAALTAWALWPRTPADAGAHPSGTSTGAGQLGGAPGSTARSAVPTGASTAPGAATPTVTLSITATPTPVVSITPVATVATAPRKALGASYRVAKDPVLGYTVAVTITNANSDDVRGWLVTFQLSGLKLLVSNVKGANVEVRAAATYLFTPTAATLVVPAGGSVSFSFSVTGLSAVAGCSIDGQSCSG